MNILYVFSNITPLISSQDTCILWNCHASNDTNVTSLATQSILTYQERYFYETRKEFLKFIHNLGYFCNNSFCKCLQLPDGFSAWWFSSLFERHPEYYGDKLYEVFKLRAFEHYLKEHSPCSVIVDDSLSVAGSIIALCRAKGITCELVPGEASKEAILPPLLQRIKSRMQQTFVGNALRHAWLLWRWWRDIRRKFPAHPTLHHTKGKLLGTWFPNIDMEMARAGEFRSRYWEGIHDILKDSKEAIHWFFVHADTTEKINDNLALRDSFLRKASTNCDMAFWEECLTPWLATHAFTAWSILAFKTQRLDKYIRKAFDWPDSDINTFALFAPMWRDSTRGWHLLYQLLIRESVHAYCAYVGAQHLTVTSSELQFWERMLFYEQRKLGCNQIYAAQHSVIREADFRFFCAPESWSLPEFCAFMPDRFFCNGEAALKSMRASNFPDERLGLLEAVRFMYLAKAKRLPPVPSRRLLVVTSYFVQETVDMLRILAEAMRSIQFPSFEEVLVKPHPFVPVDRWVHTFFEVPPQIVGGAIEQYFTEGTMIFVASGTSVALLAVYMNLPVVVMAPENTFDMSSLSGVQSVRYIRRADELLRALVEPCRAAIGHEYFLLDNTLPRWRALLCE